MTDVEKQEILNASIYTLLSWVRFTSAGQGKFADKETGDLVLKTLGQKRSENPGEFVSASKALGW